VIFVKSAAAGKVYFFGQCRREIHMENRHYYYARVSSTGQNLARQLDAFFIDGAEERDIITDKQSGKNLDRPGYQALKTTLLRGGDTLTVTSLDRLSRCKADIKEEIRWMSEHGIRLRVLDIPTTLQEAPEGQEWIMDMVTNILIEVTAAFAETERRNIRTRQAEGIAAKRKRPDWKEYGRPKVVIPDNWEQTIVRWKSGEISAVQAMQMTGVKKTSFYKLVKEEGIG
jgi:DNA invertase Pin-like site-specific DNA recombinase